MAKGKRLSWPKRIAIATALTASIAAAGHFGVKAHVNHLNVDAAARNMARTALQAKEVPVELSYRRVLSGKNPVYNPNKAGICAGYATRIAKTLFGKKFSPGIDAWDLPSNNRVVFRAGFDRSKLQGGIPESKLSEMIGKGEITPGTIIGIFYRDSPNNRLDRPFTHMAVYAGNGRFFHNFKGPNAITLDEIYSVKAKNGGRAFFPLVVIEPK